MSTYQLDKQRSVPNLVTTNGAQAVLFTYTPPAPGVHLYKAVVLAATNDYGIVAAWELSAVTKAVASVPGLIGSITDLLGGKRDLGAALWAATISISNSNVQVLVTGAAATTINWVCYFSANTFTP